MYEVKLIGLNQLERVVIGEYSFGEGRMSDYCTYALFYLKDCEKVKELKIGRGSFQGYSVCEIDGVPSLEVIEMGVLDEESRVFCETQCFELKSVSHRVNSQVDLPKLRTLLVGCGGLLYCERVVLESERFAG